MILYVSFWQWPTTCPCACSASSFGTATKLKLSAGTPLLIIFCLISSITLSHDACANTGATSKHRAGNISNNSLMGLMSYGRANGRPVFTSRQRCVFGSQ